MAMPPRNAKGRFMKRGHSSRRRKARSNPRRAHRAHRHTTRRRYSARRAHHAAPRRRRARRNPRFSIPSTRAITGTLGGALIGASGALALDLALSFGGQYLPASVAVPGWQRNLLRLGGAFLIGAVAGLVTKHETARAIRAGAVTVVVYSITKDLLNQYALPATMQLADDGGAYPWAWNPYLAHGGSASGGGDQGGINAYLPGPGVRSYNLPRVRAGAGATASSRQRVSAYVDDGVTSPGGSLGADIEL